MLTLRISNVHTVLREGGKCTWKGIYSEVKTKGQTNRMPNSYKLPHEIIQTEHTDPKQ
jgi:hypothetical protein